jgi:predicted 2-oxoglutarate/Fe(II)-dependent dioxygenase YbiX
VPSADFFRLLGVLVLKEFLDRASCENLISEICASRQHKALLTRGLDETVRKSQQTTLLESCGPSVRSRLRELKPELERHFDSLLEDCEQPQFLNYGTGDFFRPHLDNSSQADSPEFLLRRRISIVVFLNSARNDAPENDFGGGELVLYGLMKGVEWQKCGFPVTPETGLLMGFPAQTLHEVRPVTFGRRFSIASWFYSPAKLSI